ncbi:7995_t:CDS:2, partial [Dentiscutata erythropus]
IVITEISVLVPLLFWYLYEWSISVHCHVKVSRWVEARVKLVVRVMVEI